MCNLFETFMPQDFSKDFKKQVKPGFTNYQPHPKYFWARSNS